MVDHKRRIGELEDEIKRRNERISELRDEIDKQRELIGRMREALEDNEHLIENWIDAFEMVMGDDGKYRWDSFIDERDEIIGMFVDLRRRWNKVVPLLNQQNVGRPLAASEAQAAQVVKLRKAGKSLRGIAADTSLGLSTVRTIIAKQSGTDRTTQKHRGRIEIDQQQQARWKRQKRSINALPRRINQVLEDGRELVKEAKGLGRAK
jgi:predicted  nucleic acid-binding Zn-ribbon protein